MSLKCYGIYIAYPPEVDLRAQGLGRHLAELLRAAQSDDHLRFVIVCPSWVRPSLRDLCEANGIALDRLDVVSPEKEPLFLRTYRAWTALRARQKRGRLKRLLLQLTRRARRFARALIKEAVGTRSVSVVLLGLAIGIPAALFAIAVAFVFRTLRGAFRWTKERLFTFLRPAWSFIKLPLLSRVSHQFPLVRQLYGLMEEAEAGLLVRLAESRTDVRAWLAPTAFWPHFNRIRRPRLMCVPDVVFTEFPVPFGKDSRFLAAFRQIESSIRGADHIVTYSEEVKWRTVVDRFHVDPERVEVVQHGANVVDQLITIKGTPDDDAATWAFCRSQFKLALNKSIGWIAADKIEPFPFLFYASQFRPSKNILNLLRAYEFLLRRRYLGMKLLLTGDPNVMPEVSKFLETHNLRNDVLCLHGLTNQEWAACYKLATLAVNPSLAEGGCPFTFSEALSVGTPVVMARIAVTEEVITDPNVQAITLFDPYDWRDIAGRIEYALANRDSLYRIQRKFYSEVLSKRTWGQVVNEYISILDRISGGRLGSEVERQAPTRMKRGVELERADTD